MTWTKVTPTRAPRITELSAVAEKHRLEQVYAQAVGQLRRMTGLKLDEQGMVDPVKLDEKLAGQDVQRRLVLKSLLSEIGAIPR